MAELVDAKDWRRWLEVVARFPRYSFRNTLLIHLQRPDATAVMGYRAWQGLGRQVRRGERGICILAPCTYRADRDHDDQDDDQGEPARVLRGFRGAHVFDVSQTDGEPLPVPAGVGRLEGEAPAGLWDTLAGQVRAAGFDLSRAPIPSGANGTTNFAGRLVTVEAALSAAQAVKTLAHDLLTAPGRGPPLGRRDLFQWCGRTRTRGRDRWNRTGAAMV